MCEAFDVEVLAVSSYLCQVSRPSILPTSMHEFTDGCANQILKLAEEEFAKINGQLEGRLIEKDDELQGLPEQPQHVEQAVHKGVREASLQKQEPAKQLERLARDMEFTDDTYD